MLLNYSISITNNNKKRWALASALSLLTTICLCCSCIKPVMGMQSPRGTREIDEVEEPTLMADPLVPMDVQAQFPPPYKQPMPKYLLEKQKKMMSAIFDSLFGEWCSKWCHAFSKHDSAKSFLEKKIAEVEELMLFAQPEQFEHFKEVMKTMLYMKQILLIIKVKKETAKGAKDHMKTQMRQMEVNKKQFVSPQYKATIKAKQHEINNMRKGQKKIKAELSKVQKALRSEQWILLNLVTNRNSNCVEYKNAVDDWLEQTVASQPIDQVDQWEFVNGHINKNRVEWKKTMVIHDGEPAAVGNSIEDEPAKAANLLYSNELKALRADAIMEWQVRKKFASVATKALRNYAAISEAMDEEEINIYWLIEGDYLHKGIRCTKNLEKRFNNEFDERMDRIAEHAMGRQFVRTNSTSSSSRSAEHINNEIIDTIERYSFKTLLAPTRAERNEAMEVLKIAVFLREFYKNILPQIPDETKRMEAENKKSTIDDDLARLNDEIEKIQNEINGAERELSSKNTAFVNAINGARAQGNMDGAARMEAEMKQALDFIEATKRDLLIRLNDMESSRKPLMRRMKDAQVEYVKVEDEFEKGRKKAKMLATHLRGNKPLSSVLNRIDKNTQTNHFFDAAFRNWKRNTLDVYATQKPKFVDEGGLVREARDDDDTQQLLAVVQLEARREFQKIASKVLINFALLSHAMTKKELDDCATVLSWFHAVDVQKNDLELSTNGDWNEETELMYGRGKKGSATQFVAHDINDDVTECDYEPRRHLLEESGRSSVTESWRWPYEEMGTGGSELLQTSALQSEIESEETEADEPHYLPYYRSGISQIASDTDTATDGHQRHFVSDSDSTLRTYQYSSPAFATSPTLTRQQSSSTQYDTDQGAAARRWYASTDTDTSTSQSVKQPAGIRKTPLTYAPPSRTPPPLPFAAAGGLLSSEAGSETETSVDDTVQQRRYGTSAVNLENSQRTVKKAGTSGATKALKNKSLLSGGQ